MAWVRPPDLQGAQNQSIHPSSAAHPTYQNKSMSNTYPPTLAAAVFHDDPRCTTKDCSEFSAVLGLFLYGSVVDAVLPKTWNMVVMQTYPEHVHVEPAATTPSYPQSLADHYTGNAIDDCSLGLRDRFATHAPTYHVPKTTPLRIAPSLTHASHLSRDEQRIAHCPTNLAM